eukprot:299518-Rhodomonas_salina.3
MLWPGTTRSRTVQRVSSHRCADRWRKLSRCAPGTLRYLPTHAVCNAPVPTWSTVNYDICLRTRRCLGTDAEYGATRTATPLVSLLNGAEAEQVPICPRVCYAIPGTVVANAAPHCVRKRLQHATSAPWLRACYAMLCTDLLSYYGRAMRCPVLT